jgi:CRISPR-associated endonuclease/helicase Cas3
MLYSHYEVETGYNKTLLEHIVEVADGLNSIDEALNGIGLFKDFDNRQQIYKLIAYLHDFGKATTYFQDKLHNREAEELKRNPKLANHALLGAVLGLYFSEQLMFELPFQMLIYRLLHSHHSNIHKPFDNLKLSVDDIRNLGLQYANILRNPKTQDILQLISAEIGCMLPEEDQFNVFIKKATKKIVLFGVTSQTSGCVEMDRMFWFYFYLLSALNRSDKHSASLKCAYNMVQTNSEVFGNKIGPSVIDRFLETNRFSTKPALVTINILRSQFYCKVSDNISKVHLDNHLFTIHAPTGIGKTLTLLNASFKLQSRLKAEFNVDYRIVYGLPFLSIIDQVSEEITGILDNNDLKTDWRLFQEYHHLSTPESGSQGNMLIDQIQLISSFLDSQIVLTTFVSLFEAISDSHQSIKLISLARSIIIIDEIQSLDAGLYAYAVWFIKCLAVYFNCYIIVSSATIPNLFLSSDFFSIVGHEDEIENNFSQLNRYTVHRPISMRYEECQVYLESCLTSAPKKSYLIVTNTKSMAYELASWLRLQHDNVYYLSTLVVPYQRIARINAIKKDHKPKIVVSTQLIEAGVDLSVDTIFRFFAPLDSIIQTAGRTNRGLELGNLGGNVHLIDMVYENGRKDYQSVYVKDSFRSNGDIRISKSKSMFENILVLEENQLYQLGKEFFKDVSDSVYWPKTYSLLENHRWNEFGDNIRVISNDIPSKTVLICAGKWAACIQVKYKEYLRLLHTTEGNSYQRKAEMRDLMRCLAPHSLNLSQHETEKLYQYSQDCTHLQMITEQYDEFMGLELYSESSSLML